MSFKEWLKLNEVGTTSADVAIYARPMIASRSRRFVDPMTFGKEDPFFKKRKKGNCVACQQHLP